MPGIRTCMNTYETLKKKFFPKAGKNFTCTHKNQCGSAWCPHEWGPRLYVHHRPLQVGERENVLHGIPYNHTGGLYLPTRWARALTAVALLRLARGMLELQWKRQTTILLLNDLSRHIAQLLYIRPLSFDLMFPGLYKKMFLAHEKKEWKKTI